MPAIGPNLYDVDELFRVAETQALSSGWMEQDGMLVLTAGFPFGVAGSTNFLHVMDMGARSGEDAVKERPDRSST